MFNKRSLLFLLAAALMVVVGCSDQSDPTNPESFTQQLSAMVRGEISKDQVDFEFAAELGKGFEDPDQGSILVRGRNLAYDSELGALTVDLSVYNDSDSSFPEPVGLTFVQFIPADVTILNSDNDQNGIGALVMFEFDNDDGSWGPGEESQSRSVQFNVASGVSVGFVGRIDVGMTPDGGAIGGMVWNDENEDGVIDPDEVGVGGVTMMLHAGQDTSVAPLSTEVTAEDGSYLFEGQDAGYYTVVRMPQDGLVGTTPPEMAVILVEMDGTVSDFLLANFGVKTGDVPPVDDFVRVGDYVDAQGQYYAEPHRMYAEKFKVKRCDGDDDGDDDDGDDDGDDDDDDDGDDDGDKDGDDDFDKHGCRQNDCWGRLAGPVTDVNNSEGYIEIMGTKVYGHDKDPKDPWDFERGIRVRVEATRDLDTDDAMVMACKKLHWWNGNRDRIKGFVQEVVYGDEGNITGVIVLNTLIEVSKDNCDPK